MKNVDFKTKAEDLLKRLDKIKSDGDKSPLTNETLFNPYPGLRELMIEFVHLVYSFDPNLPLNKLISDMPNIQIRFGTGERVFSEIRYYINFFICYIEEYCE